MKLGSNKWCLLDCHRQVGVIDVGHRENGQISFNLLERRMGTIFPLDPSLYGPGRSSSEFQLWRQRMLADQDAHYEESPKPDAKRLLVISYKQGETTTEQLIIDPYALPHNIMWSHHDDSTGNIWAMAYQHTFREYDG